MSLAVHILGAYPAKADMKTAFRHLFAAPTSTERPCPTSRQPLPSRPLRNRRLHNGRDRIHRRPQSRLVVPTRRRTCSASRRPTPANRAGFRLFSGVCSLQEPHRHQFDLARRRAVWTGKGPDRRDLRKAHVAGQVDCGDRNGETLAARRA